MDVWVMLLIVLVVLLLGGLGLMVIWVATSLLRIEQDLKNLNAIYTKTDD